MIFFSLEDYFYNITPVKRWGFTISFILVGSIWQYNRLVDNYLHQKLSVQKIYAQQNLLANYKDILAKKNIRQDYCDFYKLDYAELKILLRQIADSNNYIKNISLEPDLEPDKEKIIVHLDFDS
jgi:hypothetical protein